MKLLEQVEINLNWADANLVAHPTPEYKRSTGVHLMQVLRHVAVSTGQLVVGDEVDDDMPLRVLLGMGWEWAAARLYPDMWWQPGELCRDGVYGTPDGISDLNPKEVTEASGWALRCVDEFKYTRKSLRTKGGKPDQWKDITREWLWMQQCMGYANMVNHVMGETGSCWHARLHVLWACGNYDWADRVGGGARERYVRYLVQFSEGELESNWRMVMANKGAV